MKCQNEVNEAFVAGVGFDLTPGYRVGYRTSGLENNSHYMRRFDDGRSDVSIPVRTKELSVTVFPANQKTMMVIAADSSVESRVDPRCHVFSHGFLVGNELFRHEMLPYLDANAFDAQVCRGPAEEFSIASDGDIKFKRITKRIAGKKSSKPETSVEASSRKGIFCFAVKALAKGSHYLVDGNGVSVRALQCSLYRMLPPPLCYQLETCSLGEYSKMFDVLFCCEVPYRNVGGYKKIRVEDILSQNEYAAYEIMYPKIFAIMEKEDGMREEYYTYMEEHVPRDLLASDKSITDIFGALEACAHEYELFRLQQAGINEDFETEIEFETMSPDVAAENADRKLSPADTMSASLPLIHVKTPETTESENEKMRKKREKVWVKQAQRRAPNEKISDLISDYIQTGSLEDYRELKLILFGDGVNPELRNVQRARLRTALQNRDANSILSKDRRTRYILCIMLSYELSPEEYYQQLLRMEGEELKPGPYDYAQALKFIRINTENPGKNERLLRKMALF